MLFRGAGTPARASHTRRNNNITPQRRREKQKSTHPPAPSRSALILLKTRSVSRQPNTRITAKPHIVNASLCASAVILFPWRGHSCPRISYPPQQQHHTISAVILLFALILIL
jgi:hypothetical protein